MRFIFAAVLALVAGTAHAQQRQDIGAWLQGQPAATAIGPTDLLFIYQGGVDKKIAGSAFSSSLLGSNNSWTGTNAFTASVTAPTATFGDNSTLVATTAFVQANGGGALINALPQFTTPCNPTGITAPAVACPAVTALSPLNINTSTNVLSLAGTYTSNNTFYGFNSGNGTFTGLNNTAFGFSTLSADTSGGNNTAIGGNALSHCTTCSQNMALGYNAMAGLVTGVNNAAVGYQAMLVAGASGAANGNTGIGQQAFFGLTTGAINTAVGAQAGNSVTTGQFNTFLGGLNSTGSHSITTGSNNTVICSYTTGLSLGITTGSNNVILGCPTGLATGSSGKLVFADGAGNIRADYGNTTASVWTFGAPLASTGALTAATTLQSTTVYSAAGTALPTCNAGAEGMRAAVSDATSPTFNAAYTSGGAVHTSVYCTGTGGWVTN